MRWKYIFRRAIFAILPFVCAILYVSVLTSRSLSRYGIVANTSLVMDNITSIEEPVQRHFGLSLGTEYFPDPAEVKEECLCDGQYDFCYSLPENGKRGKRFNCGFVKIMQSLGLLDRLRSNYINFDLGDQLPTPKFVTAFSSNHHSEGIRLIELLQKFQPNAEIILYDLGLTEDQRKDAEKMCQVELRMFNFGNYPSYVRNLGQYRWKPILIAEALRDFGAIWYMDSSVTFKKSDLSHVYELVTCRKDHGYKPPEFDAKLIRSAFEMYFGSTYLSPDPRSEINGQIKQCSDKGDNIESGWDKAEWTQSVAACDKSAYLLHGFTGHGIFSATNPKVYEYLPTNEDRLKQEAAKMYEAGFIFAVRTPDVIKDVLKWSVNVLNFALPQLYFNQAE